MKLLQLVSLVNLVVLAWACPDEEHDHHGHSHSKRAFPSTTLTLPSRPLEWGDINFIHTTDSHGWLLGHQKQSFPEPNYRCVKVTFDTNYQLVTPATLLAVTSVTFHPSFTI